jgi:hypothetical protein
MMMQQTSPPCSADAFAAASIAVSVGAKTVTQLSRTISFGPSTDGPQKANPSEQHSKQTIKHANGERTNRRTAKSSRAERSVGTDRVGQPRLCGSAKGEEQRQRKH